MSRKLKNVMMIILLVMLIGSSCLLVGYARDYKSSFTFRELMQMDDVNIPGKPSEEFTEKQQPPMENEGKQPLEMPNEMKKDVDNRGQKEELPISYYIFFGIEGLAISWIVLYLIMSKGNKYSLKETFRNTDKIVIFILGIIIMSIGLSSIMNVASKTFTKSLPNTEEKKDTNKEDVSKGTVVTNSIINLSNYNSNITLTEAKEYTITGNFEYAILIDSKDEVVLNLDNVTINNKNTAAIINVNNVPLVINLLDNTTNTLSDGGSSEYDACIYSEGPLTINGTGTLNIYGNQEEGEGIATETNNITINDGKIYIESNDDGINAGGDGGTITINNGNIEIKASGDGIDSNQNLIINGGSIYSMGSSIGGDAGIDTDAGFEINGGTVIALGSDMLETPLKTSKQYTLCFNLKNKVTKGTSITLLNEENETILSFEAKEDFKTLIISIDSLKDGTYSLYQGEEIVNINNQTSFRVSNTITKVG